MRKTLLFLLTLTLPISADFITESLLQTQPLIMEAGEARPLRWGEWAEYTFDSSAAREIDLALAEELLPLVRERRDHKLNRAVRRFTKHAIRRHGEEEPLIALRRAVLAQRLRMEEKELAVHPDFEAFVLANHLDIRMFFHGFGVDWSFTAEPLLPVDGSWLPIGQIPVDEEGKLTDHMFTRDGLVRGRPERELLPWGRAEKPPETHVVEVVTCTCHGSHAWLRLKGPNGDVYSVGFWPKEKRCHPLRTILPQAGAIIGPDPYEYFVLPEDQLVAAIPIAEEDFDALLDYCRHLQREDELCYELLGRACGTNCFSFVKQVIGQIGIVPEDNADYLPFENPYGFRKWQRTFSLPGN